MPTQPSTFDLATSGPRFIMALLRTLLRSPAASLPILRVTGGALNGIQKSRNLSYVPVDDLVNGLTEEQIQVTSQP